MEVAPAPVAIVAVPFPAQGHLNQMLHLSLLLASRGLDVHYAALAPHVRQARARARARAGLGRARRPLAPLRHPRHPALRHAAARPRQPHRVPGPPAAALRRVLRSRSRLARPPPRGARRLAPPRRRRARQPRGLPRVGGVAAAQRRGVRPPVRGAVVRRRVQGPQPPPGARARSARPVTRVLPHRGVHGPGGAAGRARRTRRRLLLNSCRALEGEFIDAQAETLSLDGKRLFSIGPLNPLLELDATTPAPSVQPRHECMDWLDKQPPSSVLYLCFGTMTSLPGKQIEELAGALQSSEQRFIWVLRDADRADIFTEAGESRHAKLMSEFTKRTEGRGLVITGWAPQLEILAHGATAAFVSHCGWNLLLEGLSHGKPILAWPMHSDQPWNAGYVCGHLKAGIVMTHEAVGEEPGDAAGQGDPRGHQEGGGLRRRHRRAECGEGARRGRSRRRGERWVVVGGHGGVRRSHHKVKE